MYTFIVAFILRQETVNTVLRDSSSVIQRGVAGRPPSETDFARGGRGEIGREKREDDPIYEKKFARKRADYLIVIIFQPKTWKNLKNRIFRSNIRQNSEFFARSARLYIKTDQYLLENREKIKV